MPVRDASQLLYPAVQQAIAELGLLGSDAAIIKLAQQYARVIDSQPGHCRGCDGENCTRSQTSAWAMRWLGPELLKVLESLGATPAARKNVKTAPEPPKNALDALRAARTRQNA